MEEQNTKIKWNAISWCETENKYTNVAKKSNEYCILYDN